MINKQNHNVLFNSTGKDFMRQLPSGRWREVPFNSGSKDGFTAPKMTFKGKRVYVARAMWETFVGEIPKNMNIIHKNGDRWDNSIENLEIISAKQHAINSTITRMKNKNAR